MGWTGHFLDRNPKGRERIEEVIRLEGLNWENDNVKDEVIDSALVGTTCYFAIRRTRKKDNSSRVFGTVCLTHFMNYMGCKEFRIKVMDEIVGPIEARCPLRILMKLTETTNECALDWRKRCLHHMRRKYCISKDGIIV